MATLYQRGDSWILSWQEGQKRRRRQRRKSLGAISEHEARRHLEAKIIALSALQPVSSSPTFIRFVEDYIRWHRTEYPSSHYRVDQILRLHLVPRFEFTPLDLIEPFEVERYKASRLADVKSATVGKELRVLKAVLNRAVAWKVITENPIAGVSPPQDLDSRPPRFYTAEELAAIYAASNHIHSCTWRFLANTGLRRTEALQLKRKDVGEESIRVVSSAVERTKSGRWREIPLSPGAREALSGLLGNQYVLPRLTGHSLSQAFTRTLVRANDALIVADRVADLDGSLHCLRHTFCSHLVMGGVDLRTVQVLAGHADLKTTERYAHLAPGHLQNAMAVLKL